MRSQRVVHVVGRLATRRTVAQQWLRSWYRCLGRSSSGANPRLFATRYGTPQLKLIAMEDALGDGGWLRALSL